MQNRAVEAGHLHFLDVAVLGDQKLHGGIRQIVRFGLGHDARVGALRSCSGDCGTPYRSSTYRAERPAARACRRSPGTSSFRPGFRPGVYNQSSLPSETNSLPGGCEYAQRIFPGLRSMSSPLSVRRALPGGVYCSVKRTCSVCALLYRASTPFRRRVQPRVRVQRAHRQQPNQQPKLAHIRLTQRRGETCKTTSRIPLLRFGSARRQPKRPAANLPTGQSPGPGRSPASPRRRFRALRRKTALRRAGRRASRSPEVVGSAGCGHLAVDAAGRGLSLSRHIDRDDVAGSERRCRTFAGRVGGEDSGRGGGNRNIDRVRRYVRYTQPVQRCSTFRPSSYGATAATWVPLT